MMLYDYQNMYNTKPTSKLAAYCRLEGLDPLYVKSTAKKENQQNTPIKYLSALYRLLKEWMGEIKPLRLFGHRPARP